MELSKTFLVLIEALGLGAFGLDRLYVGCIYTGMTKLVLLLAGLFLYYVNEFLGLFILTGWSIFVLFDYIIVFVNTLAGSMCNPFCNAPVVWVDIGPAAWVLTLIILVDLLLAAYGVYSFGPFSGLY